MSGIIVEKDVGVPMRDGARPVAKGWLRVSLRELDPQFSLPYRPHHHHRRRLYLSPGEIVRVEVEIWPTSMVFRRATASASMCSRATESAAPPTCTPCRLQQRHHSCRRRA